MTGPRRARGVLAAALLLAVVASGCGDATPGPARASRTDTAGVAAGDWLLRFATAEGADGEQSRAVYVHYDPATGAASARALPPQRTMDVSGDEQVLLVSADHRWALPDTAVPKAQARAGKLVIYSTTDDRTETLDVGAATGKDDVRAVGWAFDPTEAAVLRLVDSRLRVWRVDLSAHTATQERQLPRRAGWIFGNGFDKNTGEPYVESIDSDQTDPAGSGDSDTRPVERQHGTVVPYDGEPLDGLPTPPCGVAGAFRFDDGRAWLFCADTPSIRAYVAGPSAGSWQAQGKPSARVVTPDVAELSYVLPPVD
jgi:hypothetical protein